jgi:hypothetical protein
MNVTPEEDTAWLAYISDKRRFSKYSPHQGRLTSEYRSFINGYRAGRESVTITSRA